MLKFTKYFFIIFVLTTVIPHVTISLWCYHQMQKSVNELNSYMLEYGENQIKSTLQAKIQKQQKDLVYKISKLKNSDYDLINDFNELKSFTVKTTKSEPDSIDTYYELKDNKLSSKKSLYITTILPMNNKGYEFTKEVSIEEFCPEGPFRLKLYDGAEVNNKTLISAVEKTMLPPIRRMFHSGGEVPGSIRLMMPPPDSPNAPKGNFMQPAKQQTRFDIKMVADKEIKQVKVKNKNGETVLTLVLHTLRPSKAVFFHSPLRNAILFMVIIAGTLSSLIIAVYIEQNFMRPLLTLSEGLNKIKNGNINFKLDTGYKQGLIVRAFRDFNKMIKSLREKNDLRNSFITNLTHDLRTPLIAQERALELITDEFEKLNLEDAYNLAKGIEKNNQHLLRMVNLILESYKFDSEKLELYMTELNISDIINNCFDNVKPIASAKNISLTCNITDKFPTIKGDKTCFTRIFINLISNAIENINEGDTIVIDGKYNEEDVEITVKDSGPGISSEDIPYIFDRYYTGKSNNRKIGSGLGLYVCRKLIQMHHGAISVESVVNEYTKFELSIPRVKFIK